MRIRLILSCMALVVCGSVVVMVAQPPPEFGRPGRGGGPGGPGPSAEERKLLKRFDSDQNGWLNSAERQTARAYVQENPVAQRGPGDRGPGFGPPGGDPLGLGGLGFGPPGFGPPGFGPGGPGRRGGGPPGMGLERPSASPGESIAKTSVEPLHAELYDPDVLRTVFIDFDHDQWESELEDFHGTDIDVAATVTVDGQVYPNCGIHFRGMSSYGMVPAGYKRSLNVSVDMADQEQRLLGYKTLNLLNGSGDASMMSTVLYSHIAGKLEIPAPKANLVRVVINGENWGIYTNVQQFNKEFLQEQFGTDQGARWKVSGSPAGGGGLDYRGPDPERYQQPYERKSGGKEATAKLIELCRVLAETPTQDLPAALEPLVDIDGLLKFLALDIALINSDGYWVRASDYSIYLDPHDKFHFIPHDMNEAFRGAGGPGMGGPGMGPRGRSGPSDNLRDRGPERGGLVGSPLELDPLSGMDDPSKPLRSKVLAVPQYRQQYLKHVRRIAEVGLDWSELGPFVERQVALVGTEIERETRKLASYEAFVNATNKPHGTSSTDRSTGARGGHGSMNLYEFVEGRRAYLLKATAQEESRD
jgi:spore coat protein CotH